MPDGAIMDFSSLFHAYGRATDTPAHLAALADGDASAREAALRHLRSAIMHQGTPWTATGPAAAAVARLLDDPRLSGVDAAPLRAELLEFLTDMAGSVNQYRDDADFARAARTDWQRFDAELPGRFAALVDESDGDEEDAYEVLFEDEDLSDRLLARGFVGCAQSSPLLLGPVLRRLDDSEPGVRRCAAEAATELLTMWRVGVRLGLVQADRDARATADALAPRVDGAPADTSS